jgi:hypothetical protein
LFSGIDAGLPMGVRKFYAIAHQAAGLSIGAERPDHGQRVARRKRCEVHAVGDEQHVGVDNEPVGPPSHKNRESRVDVAFSLGAEDFDLPTNGGCHGPHVLCQRFRQRIFRIHQHGEACRCRQQLMQKLKPLGT